MVSEITSCDLVVMVVFHSTIMNDEHLLFLAPDLTTPSPRLALRSCPSNSLPQPLDSEFATESLLAKFISLLSMKSQHMDLIVLGLLLNRCCHHLAVRTCQSSSHLGTSSKDGPIVWPFDIVALLQFLLFIQVSFKKNSSLH